MDETTVLLDARTGLYVRWYFWLRVLDEANRSARYGDPFALLLLDAGGGTDRQLEDASGRLSDVVRISDLAGALESGRVGILLPKQDVKAAEEAASRITSALQASSPAPVRWIARLLCYPADAAEIANQLTAGSRERSEAQVVLRAG